MRKNQFGTIFLLTISCLIFPWFLDKTNASLTEKINENVKSIREEGKGKSPNIFLINAEKIIEDKIFEIEKEKKLKEFSQSITPVGMHLFTEEEIEASRMDANAEETQIKVTTRKRAKEILDSILSNLRSTLCPKNKELIEPSVLINAALVATNDLLSNNTLLADVSWEIAKAIITYIVAYILDNELEKFCQLRL